MSLLSDHVDNFHQCISGRAEFFPHHNSGNFKLHVGVKCMLGGAEYTDVALLDTGAQWSMMGGETAEILNDFFGPAEQTIKINSRFGSFTYTLRRLSINLLADHNCGNNLVFDATVAVSAEYPGPVILGYQGFLEHLLFGLEPSISADGTNSIYFGKKV